jgi:undecaprenyl pyrophosphate phosphatase UppP
MPRGLVRETSFRVLVIPAIRGAETKRLAKATTENKLLMITLVFIGLMISCYSVGFVVYEWFDGYLNLSSTYERNKE